MTPRSRVRMPPRRLDQLLSIGFVLFWLLPITYVGLLGETIGFAPDAVKPLYHIACLFADRAETHANFYYQVQLRGSKRWVSVPESDLSRLKPYNYSRVHLYLNRLPNSEGSELRGQKLAEFIRSRSFTRRSRPSWPRASFSPSSNRATPAWPIRAAVGSGLPLRR